MKTSRIGKMASITLFLMLSFCQEKKDDQYQKIEQQGGSAVNPSLAIHAAYGWSTQANEKQAAKEALAKMHHEMKDPDVIVMYATVDYDLGKLVEHIAKGLSERTPIFGMTSCKGVVTSEGVHRGADGAVAIMGIDSDNARFIVAGTPYESDDEEFSQRVAAVIDTLALDGREPSMILIAVTPGLEELCLEHIRKRFGSNTPVMGGSAADNTVEGNWRVFNGRQIYKKGVSLAAIHTAGQVGYSYASGYLVTSQSGVVTKVGANDRRVIETIDGKPAGVVLNEMTKHLSLTQTDSSGKGYFFRELESGESILMKAGLTPLAKRYYAGDEEHYVCGHPASIDPRTKSLSLFASFDKGDTVHLLEGKKDALLNRPEHVALSALSRHNIKKSDAEIGFFIYCAGTMLTVEDEIDTVITSLNKVMKGVPIIGAFTFGEQGTIPGLQAFHGNLMNSLVILSNQKNQ